MIFTILGAYWFWIPLVTVLAYLTWRNYYKADKLKNMPSSVLLVLEVPRDNDKKELAAEQMFASLHGILRPSKDVQLSGHLQEHLSFEIAAIGDRIRFYVWVPAHLQNFVEGQIYAQYPSVQIYKIPDDYTNRDFTGKIISTTEISLADNEMLPIKTFTSFEVDPLAAITATLSKLGDDSEEVWIQIITRPIDDKWHRKGVSFSNSIKNGGELFTSSSWIAQVFATLWRPPEYRTTTVELSERDKSRLSAAEEKSRKLGYRVKIRLVYIGHSKTAARLRTQAIIGAFKQYNSTNLNRFITKSSSQDPLKLQEYRARFFIDKGFILNTEELASLFHLPHTNVETPNIVWASSKTAEPPANLPTTNGKLVKDVSPFGLTRFRGYKIQFGTKRVDRSRHMYIIGQTGVGKSGLLELLTLSDIFEKQGFAIIDPHGDYATSTMRFIPKNRIQDVVYFNPADTQFPIGFNPLEFTDPSMKSHVSSELVGVLKRMFVDSWGPRLEYILRYTILALLDYPEATMLDITRMLTDKKFRTQVIELITDPVVRNFWTIEFASWNDRFASEAVAPVLNKVGAFVANPMIRNIIGQPKSTFNIRQIMDNGQILIVNLSRGLVGEDNASILGALLITKIQLAAMSRADIPNIEDRRPFYLYVDEFQNFATDSFAVILSEARKYGLNLTVANQYIGQMPITVRDAVFGNVGSIISFRSGADDAPTLKKYFEPQFDDQDIQQLNNRQFLASLSIDGEKASPFSAETLKIPQSSYNHSGDIVEHSRVTYTNPVETVRLDLANRYSDDTKVLLLQDNTKSTHSKAESLNKSGKRLPSKLGHTITNIVSLPSDINNNASVSPRKKRTRRGSRGGRNKKKSNT